MPKNSGPVQEQLLKVREQAARTEEAAHAMRAQKQAAKNQQRLRKQAERVVAKAQGDPNKLARLEKLSDKVLDLRSKLAVRTPKGPAL